MDLDREELLSSLRRQKDFLVVGEGDILTSNSYSKRLLRIWNGLVDKLESLTDKIVTDTLFTPREWDMIGEAELCDVWDSRKKKRNKLGLLHLE